MAHTRRAETSYEEHIEDCFDNRRNVLEDEQEVLQDDVDSKGGNGQKEGEKNRAPLFETFALRCRWGRVDCLVSEGIVSVLCGHIVAGAAVMQYNQSSNLHATGQRSVDADREGRDSNVRMEIEAEKERGRDSASVLALQSAFAAITILHSICRLCDKDQITSVILNIMRIWRQCLVLLDTDESSSDSKRGGLSCGWWKVIAEACRRSRDFAIWINGVQQQQESVVAKCLILLLRSAPVDSTPSVPIFGSTVDPLPQSHLEPTLVTFLRERDKLDSQRQCWDSVVWALRVWRVCAAYGVGLVPVSELLIASQLPVYSTGAISNATSIIASDGSHASKSNSLVLDWTDGLGNVDGAHSDRGISHLNSFIAQAIGPGLVTRISSSPRLTSILLLLEQTAVSCAAIIDLHTVKVKRMGVQTEINRVHTQKKGVTFKTVSPVEVEKEMIEEEVVGLALETSRLLLGVAERLLLRSYATAHSSSSSRSTSASPLLIFSDSCLSASNCLLKSASMHFVSSLIGVWQRDSLHPSSSSVAEGEGGREEGINDHVKGSNDSGRGGDDVSLVILEISSLRQHYRCTVSQHEKSRIDKKSASSKCVSRVGLGLLQSCLTYAVYVRESTTQYVEEKDECANNDIANGNEEGNQQDKYIGDIEKDIDLGLKNLKFASSSQNATGNKQFQFAALHHLESKINAFIDSSVISPNALLSLSHMLSLNELKEEGSSCALSKWILSESFFSIQRLLSSMLSYAESLTSTSSVQTSASLSVGMVRGEEGRESLNIIQAVYTAAVDRMFPRKSLHHTPLVSEGLYAWQVSRVMECILLTDLRLIFSFTPKFASANFREGQAHALSPSFTSDLYNKNNGGEGQEIDCSVLLSSCLICMRNLGQGFKRKIVLLTHIVLKMIDRLIIRAKPLIDPLSQKLQVVGANVDNVEASSITPFSESSTHDSIIRNGKGKIGDNMEDLEEENEWIQKNTLSPDLKNKLLFLLLGSKEESDKRVCFSDFATILKPSSFDDQPDSSLMNMTDWKNDYHDSTVPLRMDWPVECLSGLTGDNFERWLCVLSNLGKIPERESSQPNARHREKSDGTFNVNTDRQPYSLLLSPGVDNLYGLLRLACPDQGHRWRTLTEEKEEERVGGVEGDGDGDVCMIVGDSSESAVSAYCSLLIHSTSQISKQQQMIRLRGTGPDGGVDSASSIGCQAGGNSVCEHFIVAAQREVATTHALSSKKVKSVFPQGCVGSSFGFGVKAEGGVMELCGKLLEGLTSQTVSQGKYYLFASTPTLIQNFSNYASP